MNTHPPPAAEARTSLPRPPHRWTAWLAVLGAFAALGLLWLTAVVLSADPMPWHWTIDGEPVYDRLGWQEGSPVHRVLLAVVALAALLAALIVVPLALLVLLAAMLLAVFGVVGVPVLAVLAMLALLLSPLWLTGWLLWRVFWSSRRAAGAVPPVRTSGPV